MSRALTLGYGLFCYTFFLALYGYMALFVADAFVPKTIDQGGPGAVELGTPLAIGINLLLIACFGVQHSVMARPGFKRWWTRFIPRSIERSTYVLAANLVMVGVLLAWQPIGTTLWNVENETARTAIWVVFALSWLSIPVYSLMIDHFDLFGLRQVWLAFRGKTPARARFCTPLMYRLVRHPIYLGWMMTAWITPTMTVGHLVWAAGTTAYMLIAIPLEERDLVAEFGEKYEHYRKQVPAIVPLPGRAARPATQTAS